MKASFWYTMSALTLVSTLILSACTDGSHQSLAQEQSQQSTDQPAQQTYDAAFEYKGRIEDYNVYHWKSDDNVKDCYAMVPQYSREGAVLTCK